MVASNWEKIEDRYKILFFKFCTAFNLFFQGQLS